MKNWKKYLSLILALAMVIALAACSSNSDPAGTNTDTPQQTDSASPDNSQSAAINIALIVPADDALGINDKGWNQKVWEGITSFGDANGKGYTWYQPTDNSTQGYMNAISTAVNSGVDVVVVNGFQAAEALAAAQYDYPDTYFISVESNGVEEDLAPNHYAMFHQTDEAGFLAGVAAVKGGFTNIGIVNGLDIPPMNIWVWGYIQGLNYAAGAIGAENVTVRHTYSGYSTSSPEVQALAAAWYADGVDLIMPMVAGGNNSVFAAADAAGKPCFGADVDQGVESEMVLTSPIKKLDQTVAAALATVYDGTFPGGTYKWYTVDDDAVGLATDHWRVPNYSVEDYQKDFEDFKNDVDGVRSGLLTQDDCPTVDELWEAIPEKNIEFINIQ